MRFPLLGRKQQPHSLSQPQRPSLVAAAEAPGVVNVNLDPGHAIRELSPWGPGLNLNYLVDSEAVNNDAAAPTTLRETLQDMHVGCLRYPGGEKSDTYAFAAPPFTRVGPVLTRTSDGDWPYGDGTIYNKGAGTYVKPPLDIDQFAQLASTLGATPYIVLNCDSAFLPGGWDYNQLKAAAVAFAGHIHSRGYDMRYFELGNESYKDAYAGHATAAEYAGAMADWAPALKTAHPGMLLGANGPDHAYEAGKMDKDGTSWWQTVLRGASSHIDFLAMHPYPAYHFDFDFNDWASGKEYDFQAVIKEGERAIDLFAAAADKQRIRIAVTETAAVDWVEERKGGWQNTQTDLGHLLVLFDIMASILSHPRVDAALFWNSRWRTGNDDPLKSPNSVVNAIQDNNRPTWNGAVLKLLGRFFRSGRLLPSAHFPTLKTWAVLKPSGGATIILLNKSYTAIDNQIVNMPSYRGPEAGSVWVLQGSGPTDTNPSLSQAGTVGAHSQGGDSFAVALPATSLVVVDFN